MKDEGGREKGEAPNPQSPIPNPSVRDPFSAGVKPKTELTLPRLVGEFDKADRASTPAQLRLGRLADLWCRIEWRRSRKPRSEAMREIRAAALAAGIAGEKCRVSRLIACWWVAELFGAEAAKDLSMSVLRRFIPLVKHQAASDSWTIRSKYEGHARALWNRATSERMTDHCVETAIGQFKPRRVQPTRAREPLTRILKAIAQLDAQDLSRVVDYCEGRRRNLVQQPAAA